MYRMTEVKEVPAPRRGRRSAPHVDQLRAFLDSGKRSVTVDGIPPTERRKVYGGLKTASGRPEFDGAVTVTRDGDTIYLERRG